MHFFNAEAETLGVKKVIALDNFMLGYPKWIEKLEKNPLFDIQKFDIIKDNIADINGRTRRISSSTWHPSPRRCSIANTPSRRSTPTSGDCARCSTLQGETHPRIPLLFFERTLRQPDAAHVPTSEDYYGYVCATGPRSCYDESKRFGETIMHALRTKV